MKNLLLIGSPSLKITSMAAFKAIACVLGIVFVTSLQSFSLARELPQERDLYKTLPGESDQGTILDATNPMDLMNRLRRATAMDDATNPADTIEEALKAFEESQLNTPLKKVP